MNPLNIITLSREQIETQLLPAPSALITFADSPEQQVKRACCLRRLEINCHDSADSHGTVNAPDREQAVRILQFVENADRPFLIIQCEKGIGRSIATAAALLHLNGGDPTELLYQGTHNRKLYRLLCEIGGNPVPPDPLVSMVIRSKYGPDKLWGFIHSMQAQRYENWELIVVTDGEQCEQNGCFDDDPRFKFIETPEAKGHWGHPYRQLGIDAATGEFFGLSNDDNYYVPGYLEQMVNALTANDADLAICQTLHSYAGWSVIQASAAPGCADLGAFIARRSLTETVKWEGIDWKADGRYIARLAQAARKVVTVNRPLFVHN